MCSFSLVLPFFYTFFYTFSFFPFSRLDGRSFSLLLRNLERKKISWVDVCYIPLVYCLIEINELS